MMQIMGLMIKLVTAICGCLASFEGRRISKRNLPSVEGDLRHPRGVPLACHDYTLLCQAKHAHQVVLAACRYVQAVMRPGAARQPRVVALPHTAQRITMRCMCDSCGCIQQACVVSVCRDPHYNAHGDTWTTSTCASMSHVII